MKGLSKNQIVKICNNVLKSLEVAKKENKPAYVDLLIKMELSSIEYMELYDIQIEKFIPYFTLENAVIMANAIPDEVDGSLWWVGSKDHFDYDNQILFINFIKSCYENK